MEKQCVKCKSIKKQTDFYGKNTYCKLCIKEYVFKWRKVNRDKIKKYTQRAIKIGSTHCGVYVRNAVKRGILPDLKKSIIECVFCKKERAIIYEHRSYQKPLDVKPACGSCNKKLGSAIIRNKVN